MRRMLLAKPVVLGKIGSCYGVNGWLKIFSYTKNTESIFNYKPWFVKNTEKWKKIELESWQYHNNKYIIFKLKGINNRDTANLLVNYEIVVDLSQLPKLKKGCYYWKELIGCQVVSRLGLTFGKVTNIMETGSNDVLVVKQKDRKELLIPFLYGRVIRRVSLDIQKIEVDWDLEF